MATVIPMTICLTTTGHRRQGQTRRNHYTSLHGHRVGYDKTEETGREKEEDVNAPPQDSSDEREALVFEVEGYGEASDDFEFEEVRVGKPRSSPRHPASPPETVNKHQSVPHRSGQKRKSEHSSEDELNMSFEMSQAKRPRKSVGYGKTKVKPKLRNIHNAPPTDQEQKRGSKRKASQVNGEKKLNFVRPPTEGLLAELDRYRAMSASPKSSVSENISVESKCSKESSKGPVFKAPKLPALPPKATKAKPTFKRPIEPPHKEDSTSANRPSSRETKPLSPSKNRSNIRSVNDSAAIVATKLGLEDVTFIVPSSISNAPSPTPQSSIISDSSSPPTSFVDDATAAEISTVSLEDEVPKVLPKHAVLSQSSQSPHCPVCKAPVDGVFLEGFAGNRRMTVREQAKFCQAHKRRTAEAEWQAKGYPNIDWPFLHMQVKIHSEAIDEILRGEKFSYYRNAYEGFLKRGKHRTLQQSLAQGGGIEDFSPGYYGSRGARIMIDNLMSTFASKLRHRSSIDSLISSRGVSSYVHAVLVPELATLLVMDDLKVDAERARKVLQDSVGLGNFLNEEEDEMIKDPDTDGVVA